MNISRLNLNLLVALNALLTECNVTLAAERVFITQPAMSNALNQLRQIFKDDLLVREGRGMRLTTRAQELLPQVRHLLEQIDAVINQEIFDPATSKRIFTVGMTEGPALILLPKLYALVHQNAPSVELCIKSIDLFREVNALETREIELGISLLRDSANMFYESLFSERLVCAMRADHPLLQGEFTLEKYLEAEHVSFVILGHTRYPYVDMQLANLGYRRKIMLQVAHLTAGLLIVADSDLVATLPDRLLTTSSMLDFKLAIRSVPLPIPELVFASIWHPRSESDASHVWLRQMVKEAAAGL